MRSLLSFLAGVGVTSAWFLWPRSEPRPTDQVPAFEARPSFDERAIASSSLARIEPDSVERAEVTAIQEPVDSVPAVADEEAEAERPDALAGLSPATLEIVRSASEEETVRAFVDQIGYVPEPATLERITLVLVETQREHHARIRALYDVPDFDSSERMDRIVTGKRRAFADLFARQRALLEPLVRPDVFEEAYLKFSGQWEGPAESP